MKRGRRSAKERPSLAPGARVRRRPIGVEAPDSVKETCELTPCRDPIAERVAGVGICRRHAERVRAIARDVRAFL